MYQSNLGDLILANGRRQPFVARSRPFEFAQEE